MKTRMTISMLVTSLLLGGCATMTDTQRGTAQGAAIGAGTGAAIGAIIGGGKGAAIGAGPGAVLGAGTGRAERGQGPAGAVRAPGQSAGRERTEDRRRARRGRLPGGLVRDMRELPRRARAVLREWSGRHLQQP